MLDPVTRWAAGGLAHLTGEPGGPADFSRAGILAMADAAATPFGVCAEELLAGRSALTGSRRRGRISVGGASRLIRCRDTWAAVTLARRTDLDSLGALLSISEVIDDPWATLEQAALSWVAAELVDRAQMLEIPSSVLGCVTGPATVVTRAWPTTAARAIDRDLLVVDLSAMWAGPLCGHLLGLLGATVIKVESPRRPDGARFGNSEFFRWMNGRKLFWSTEVTDQNRDLAELIDVADVVIEASRPRALEQVGLDAASRAARPGRTWVRITGYGNGPDVCRRVAFGDDAAVAGGLVGRGTDGPVFCGDAIADPLTGLAAAHAAVTSLGLGGGTIIDVNMAGVAAEYAAVPTCHSMSTLEPTPAPRPNTIDIEPVCIDRSRVVDLIRSRSGTPC